MTKLVTVERHLKLMNRQGLYLWPDLEDYPNYLAYLHAKLPDFVTVPSREDIGDWIDLEFRREVYLLLRRQIHPLVYSVFPYADRELDRAIAHIGLAIVREQLRQGLATVGDQLRGLTLEARNEKRFR